MGLPQFIFDFSVRSADFVAASVFSWSSTPPFANPEDRLAGVVYLDLQESVMTSAAPSSAFGCKGEELLDRVPELASEQGKVGEVADASVNPPIDKKKRKGDADGGAPPKRVRKGKKKAEAEAENPDPFTVEAARVWADVVQIEYERMKERQLQVIRTDHQLKLLRIEAQTRLAEVRANASVAEIISRYSSSVSIAPTPNPTQDEDDPMNSAYDLGNQNELPSAQHPSDRIMYYGMNVHQVYDYQNQQNQEHYVSPGAGPSGFTQ